MKGKAVIRHVNKGWGFRPQRGVNVMCKCDQNRKWYGGPCPYCELEKLKKEDPTSTMTYHELVQQRKSERSNRK